MKKNGFTLIELLATLLLLGMLATIVITYSIKSTNNIKEKANETMISSIEIAAKNYVLNNESKIENFESNDYAYISLSTLINENLFTESLIDQTRQLALPMTDTVYVTKTSNGIINAVYDINQNSKPKIVLNGSYNVYIKKGKNYNELGAKGYSTTGEDISNTIVISGSVDNNTIGRYTITYKISDTSITRNVIVF